MLRAVLERRTALVRSTASRTSRGQVLAANIDTVVVTVSLADPLKHGRTERMLTLAWESGAQPVVVLTKADACADAAAAHAEVSAVSPGAEVLVTSAVTGQGLATLLAALSGTIVLLGPSGTGKSTLGNQLLGEERLATGAVREVDGKGLSGAPAVNGTDTPDHAPRPDPMTEAFFTLHHGLPRQGPGSDATTRRLLGMAGPLPKHPRVLDAGCGPGRSTLVLAEEAGAHVTAVDLHQPFLDSLTAEAAPRGLLAPHGVLVLTEIEWTVPDPATPVRAYWDALYPLRTRTANTDAAQAAGFRVRAQSPTPARTGPS